MGFRALDRKKRFEYFVRSRRLEFRAWSFRFRVEGLGFWAYTSLASICRIWGRERPYLWGLRIESLGFRICGLGRRIQYQGSRVKGLGVRD